MPAIPGLNAYRPAPPTPTRSNNPSPQACFEDDVAAKLDEIAVGLSSEQTVRACNRYVVLAPVALPSPLTSRLRHRLTSIACPGDQAVYTAAVLEDRSVFFTGDAGCGKAVATARGGKSQLQRRQ